VEGVFTKCEECGEPIYERDLRARFNVCPNCEHHYPLAAPERVRLLIDSGTFEEIGAGITPGDPLGFEGYAERLEKTRKKTGLDDAVVSGVGRIGGRPVAFAAMDFRFIGGSMGSVVGEKIALTMETARNANLPLVIVPASGGARMFEGVYSLMQMAKTSVALTRPLRGWLETLRLRAHRPHIRRSDGLFRNGGRRDPCRAKSPHRFRRTPGHRGYDERATAGRFPDC
jgi:acetyl-CoA carboxylase carboxyl transferase subunit beta